MSLRKLVAAAIAAAAIAVIAISCTAVLGLNGLSNAVDVMCTRCAGQLQFLGSHEDCVGYLERHLDALTDDERQKWLDAYVGQCSTCDRVTECFYWPKICTENGFACAQSGECCSSQDGGGCDGGSCQ